MATVEVFDPPLCCSSGVCGPDVDPALVRFATDLSWLGAQGVSVVRHNLAQEPQAFVSNAIVKDALDRDGDRCLPLVLVDGAIVARERYPLRDELARLAGLARPDPGRPSLYTDEVAELVALGASVAANCEPCFRHHFDKARKLGVSHEDMERAVRTAQAVKDTPARAMLDLAGRYLHTNVTDSAAAADSKPRVIALAGAGKPSSPCCG